MNNKDPRPPYWGTCAKCRKVLKRKNDATLPQHKAPARQPVLIHGTIIYFAAERCPGRTAAEDQKPAGAGPT